MNIKYAVLAFAFASSLAHASLVVVANHNVKLRKLPLSQLNRLFLGQMTAFPDGSAALPLDVKGKTRTAFYKEILKKDPSQMDKYWMYVIFVEAAHPPRQIQASRIKQLVASTNGAISYMDSADVDASVKIIRVINDSVQSSQP